MATSGIRPRSPGFIKRALKDLDVGLVCLPADKPNLLAQARLRSKYRPAFPTVDADCFVRRG
jgi:hypothetical protein